MPDVITLNASKKYTDTKITALGTGIKSVTNNGSQLIFTLNDNSTLTVTITGLSDENYSLIEKNKLASLNETILSKFAYSNNKLYFNGNPIEDSSVDLSNYYNKDEINNYLSNKANISDIPKNISDLSNDVNFVDKTYTDSSYELKDSTIVKDSNYVHTDNNYSEVEKAKVQAMTNSTKYIGLFSDLNDRNSYSGTLIIGYWCTVETDTDYNSKKTKYYYNGSQWIFDGIYQDNSFGIDDSSINSTQDSWSVNKIVNELDLKANSNGSNIDLTEIQGNIIPVSNGTQNLGSPTNRFSKIYVNEAMLSTNTLYIGDTPVMGTNDDTIVIKADTDQSINMKTTGVGTTKIISESGVQLSTSGMNANVNMQATGSGANANISATNEVNLNAPDVNIQGNTNIIGTTSMDNLTIRGNLTVNGGTTTIESTTVKVEDNIIELNKNETGHGVTAGKAGIKIDRGDADAMLLVFDETDDNFKVGIDSALKPIATLNDNLSTSATDTYSINKIISLLNNKQNNIIISTTKPIDLTINNFWLDISNNASYKLLRSNGSDYIQIGNSAGDNSQFEVVNALPTSDISSLKMYLLSTDKSINIYNGSSWDKYGGTGSGDTTVTTSTTNGNIKINGVETTVFTQSQSDWNQMDNTKPDFVKNKPTNLLTTSNIKQGTNINITTDENNNMIINSSSGDATSINSIQVNDSARTNGTGLFYSSTTGKYENALVTVAGIVGSSTIYSAGSNVVINAGAEAMFTHLESVNIVPSIEEVIQGSNVTDTHVDFSNNSKYILQDSSLITTYYNKAILKDIETVSDTYWNSSDKGSNVTLSNNNLTVVTTGTSNYSVRGNRYYTSGKYYWEVKFVSGSTPFLVGVANSSFTITTSSGLSNTNQISIYGGSGVLYPGAVSYGSAFSVGDTIGIKLDIDNLKINFSKNGTWIGEHTLPSWSNYYPLIMYGGSSGSTTLTTNFGASSFSYSVPTTCLPFGYKSTVNTPLYIETTSNSDYDLSKSSSIISLTIPVNLSSTNTTLKCLFSLDNKINWLYYDGSSIQKYEGVLSNDWQTYSSYTQLQALFTNLSIESLNTMLSNLNITPVTLDLCFQLKSSSQSETPILSPITMIYAQSNHNEFSSFGSYDETGVKFGIKRVSNSQLTIKNLTLVNRTIKLNVIISST